MISDFEQWEKLQRLFHLAEASPEADLDALLEAACDDPETRSHARRLILAARNSTQAGPTTPVSPNVRRIGPYSIVRLLGAGGNGSVYLGERLVGGAVQRVAVKVLSRSAAGVGFTERFAREQHILASLNHANITRMLDAGVSDDGEPYLVMEYVDGEHLDIWCDENKLDIRERLQLFLHVCEAVAYAHRNLVVHLDLKPSNVLIAREDGAVKLLDFGTSKLVQPDSLLTTTVMATPAYASPEQLLNEPVTTVCDVYALGAVLFELLSGKRPNRDSSVALLIERSMREAAPESLHEAVTQEAADRRALTQTRLRLELGGDLETIVTKCLAARPKDRYATVDALMEDVQRYLAGRPVLARPQTTTYRLGKFVRRNRKSVVAGTFAFLAIIVTSSYALWRQEQAVRAAQRALQMQTFMSELFKLANSNYMGKPAATVPEFLALGVKVIPNLIQDPGDQRAAQLSLAESMQESGDMEGAQKVYSQVIPSAAEAGDIAMEAEAEGHAGYIASTFGQSNLSMRLTAHAFALSKRRGVPPSTKAWVDIDYATTREGLGFRNSENIQILKDAVNESRIHHLPGQETAAALSNLAYFMTAHGDLDNSEPIAKEALAIYVGEPYSLCDQADIYFILGNIHSYRNDQIGSIPLYRRAFDDHLTCHGLDDEQTLSIHAYLARALMKTGHADQTIDMMQHVIPNYRKTFHSGPRLSDPYTLLARAYLATGQFPLAEKAASESFRLQDGKVKENSIGTAVAQLLWAQALAGQERNQDALRHVQLSQRMYAGLPVMSTAEQRLARQADTLERDLASMVPESQMLSNLKAAINPK